MTTDNPKWEDASHYPKGNKRRAPSTWTLKATQDLRITVTRTNPYNPENWVMYCHPWFYTYNLEIPSAVKNRDKAMSAAIALVRSRVAEALDALQRVEEPSHDD